MTLFQKKAEEKIQELAKDLNIKVVGKVVTENDAYLTGKIDEYQFWIYDSGDAGFKSNYYDRRFETFDYAHEDELLKAFLDSIKEGIVNKEKYHRNPQVIPPPLFNRMFDWISKLWRNS